MKINTSTPCQLYSNLSEYDMFMVSNSDGDQCVARDFYTSTLFKNSLHNTDLYYTTLLWDHTTIIYYIIPRCMRFDEPSRSIEYDSISQDSISKNRDPHFDNNPRLWGRCVCLRHLGRLMGRYQMAVCLLATAVCVCAPSKAATPAIMSAFNQAFRGGTCLRRRNKNWSSMMSRGWCDLSGRGWLRGSWLVQFIILFFFYFSW